jgi:preprotein translocase subunit YajC
MSDRRLKSSYFSCRRFLAPGDTFWHNNALENIVSSSSNKDSAAPAKLQDEPVNQEITLFKTLFDGKKRYGLGLLGLLISDVWATDGAPAASPMSDPLASMILPIGLIILFYFFLIRPQSKRHKQHKEMVAALQKGEEVVTTGGLLGKITHVGENFVTLEITRDVKIQVQKNSVQALMPKGTIKEQSGDKE